MSSSVALEAYHPRASWWDEWCGKCTKFNISVDGGPWFFNTDFYNHAAGIQIIDRTELVSLSAATLLAPMEHKGGTVQFQIGSHNMLCVVGMNSFLILIYDSTIQRFKELQARIEATSGTTFRGMTHQVMNGEDYLVASVWKSYTEFANSIVFQYSSSTHSFTQVSTFNAPGQSRAPAVFFCSRL
jgi:hypothetical protein